MIDAATFRDDRRREDEEGDSDIEIDYINPQKFRRIKIRRKNFRTYFSKFRTKFRTKSSVQFFFLPIKHCQSRIYKTVFEKWKILETLEAILHVTYKASYALKKIRGY